MLVESFKGSRFCKKIHEVLFQRNFAREVICEVFFGQNYWKHATWEIFFQLIFQLSWKTKMMSNVLNKSGSRNMQQIYRRTPMLKCVSVKLLSLQLYWNHTLTWVFSCKFTGYFQIFVLQKRLWRAAFGKIYLSSQETTTLESLLFRNFAIN